MTEISNEFLFYFGAAAAAFVLLQFVLSVAMVLSLRAASQERSRTEKDIFGLLRKIEGLTASKREQVARHYDTMVGSLLKRLPATIGSEASTMILETESKILHRLAELEPSFATNRQAREKMDDLIHTMEKLEQTLISVTAETVSRVMNESREDFLREENSSGISYRTM